MLLINLFNHPETQPMSSPTTALPRVIRLSLCSLSLLLLLFLLSASLAQTPGTTSTRIPYPNSGAEKIIDGLKIQLDSTRSYDPSYVAISYPAGDVPISTGVCADVVVRSLRHAGTDLQVEMHTDMKKAFRSYPQLWGLAGPDKNIDHRRVANQMRFFDRKGKSIIGGSDSSASHYLPGDIVAWMLPGNLYHIGIVTNIRSSRTGQPLIAHNIGRGAELHDCLFAWEIIGHYRWFK